MHNLFKLLSKYSTHIKYILIVVILLAMIMSIRTYLNFVAIEDAIQNVQLKTIQTQNEILYVKNFLIPYLSSEYAEYFLSHENSVLFPHEAIVWFESQSEQDIIKEKSLNQDTGLQIKDNYIYTAKDSWEHFWNERLKKIK